MAGSIDIQPVVDWLIDGAKPCIEPQAVLHELSRRLVAIGLPLHRTSAFVTTLHPIVAGRSFHWRSDLDEVTTSQATHELFQSEIFLRSPVYEVTRTRLPFRRRLTDQADVEDFEVLRDARADGVTDYLAFPLEFISGPIHVAVATTRVSDGFSDAEIAALSRVGPPLARVAEALALSRTAHSLLDAFLGHQVGERVLSGQVKRGDGEDIHAVIWFCDLRDSTPLTEAMGRGAYLALLNEYFDCIAGAVLDGGGEVLRYIGDAVLAIFPAGDDVAAACRLATAAAKDALARMAMLNARRLAAGDAPVGFGIGLHVGDVMYGNIGTPSRIEFTVIGSAANEAARIEALCKTLGVSLLISEGVRRHVTDEWISRGKQALKGVGSEIEVFTLRG